MPIYEYRCPSCHVKFEMRRGMSQADDPVVCPACQSPDGMRCLSTFAAFSKSSGGASAPVAGTGGGCAGCGGGNCGSCGH